MQTAVIFSEVNSLLFLSYLQFNAARHCSAQRREESRISTTMGQVREDYNVEHPFNCRLTSQCTFWIAQGSLTSEIASFVHTFHCFVKIYHDPLVGGMPKPSQHLAIVLVHTASNIDVFSAKKGTVHGWIFMCFIIFLRCIDYLCEPVQCKLGLNPDCRALIQCVPFQNQRLKSQYGILLPCKPVPTFCDEVGIGIIVLDNCDQFK
jgi:hypothetical protein